MATPTPDMYAAASGTTLLQCGMGPGFPSAPVSPVTLTFDALTPEQISIRGIVGRTLAAGTACLAEYKLAGQSVWRSAGLLSLVLAANVPTGAAFAGSDTFSGAIFDLTPGASYDVRLTGTEPGVGTWQVTGTRGTRALPAAAPAPNKTATPANIAAQLLTLVAGDCLELAAGTYPAITIARSGTTENPIYIRGASRAGVIISSGTQCVTFGAASHVVLENMTLQGSGVDAGTDSTSAGVIFTSGQAQTNITLRRITATGVDRGGKNYTEIYGCLVYDCTWNGNNTWAKTFEVNPVGGLPNYTWNDTGFGGPGSGNCVFNCTFTGFGDTIKLGGSGTISGTTYCGAWWVYRCLIPRAGDDAFEADSGAGNVGMYDCVIQNAGMAMSVDGVYGGPVYFFRNSVGNTARGPFKPSSTSQHVKVWSNTFVRTTGVGSSAIGNFYAPSSGNNDNWSFLNNLIVFRGPTGDAIRLDCTLPGLQWDYNALYPSTGVIRLGAGRGVHSGLTVAKAALAPLMEHDVAAISNPFVATVTMPADATTEYTGSMDFTLAAGVNVRNAGIAIPGITDGFSGNAPDIGAVITGRSAPTVGDLAISGGPSLQITGVAWTPNRDGTGAVLDTDFAQLPANTWVTVSGSLNTLGTIRPTPAYPNQGGGDSFNRMTIAWGGAAFDATTKKLHISNGGHGDASAAETGVYTLDTTTMRFGVTVNRAPLNQAATWNGSALVAGEPWGGGYNAPLLNGVPGSNHTYYGLVHLPTATMAALGLGSPTKGGLFYPGSARAVVNLDTGAYTKVWWKRSSPDNSYVAATRWGNKIILPRGSIYWDRWDMAQTETTDWATSGVDPNSSVPSFGRDIGAKTGGVSFVASSRTFLDLGERGEMISFAGSSHQRMRYGAAEDSGASTWAGYQESITLTGTDASVLNTASNFTDNGTNLLNMGGASYLHATGEVFICPNTAGSEVYRITGLASGSTGAVSRIAGSNLLTTSSNGTFGRFRVFQHAGQTLAVRVSGVDNPIEVMRIA